MDENWSNVRTLMLLVMPPSGMAEMTTNVYPVYVIPNVSRVILYHMVFIFTLGNADTEIAM